MPMKNLNSNNIFAFLVPTGIGASIGGYAGDASFWAQKFSSILPTLVNANVVNAACFSGVNENILYSEGWSIDEFFKGNLNFVPSENNKIGVIFDKGIPQDVLNIHINTINAVKTVYNVDVVGYEVTEEEVGVSYFMEDSGASSGVVKNPETMLSAGKKLLDKGANALAVVCLFPDTDDDDEYSQGNGVDIVGGVESTISHYISQNLFVPCVHAPAFKDYQISPKLVHPKAAAEYITPTFLPCLLVGLKNAPLITKNTDEGISVNNVKALIMPASSLGSSAVFSAVEKNIPIYAVEENKTVLNVTKDIFFEKECIMNIDTYESLYDILKNKSENKYASRF